MTVINENQKVQIKKEFLKTFQNVLRMWCCELHTGTKFRKNYHSRYLPIGIPVNASLFCR